MAPVTPLRLTSQEKTIWRIPISARIRREEEEGGEDLIEWLGEHRAQKTGEEAKKGEHCQASQERRGGGLRSKHISGPSPPPPPLFI